MLFVPLGASYSLVESHLLCGWCDFSATGRARANLVAASRFQGSRVFRNALTGLSRIHVDGELLTLFGSFGIGLEQLQHSALPTHQLPRSPNQNLALNRILFLMPFVNNTQEIRHKSPPSIKPASPSAFIPLLNPPLSPPPPAPTRVSMCLRKATSSVGHRRSSSPSGDSSLIFVLLSSRSTMNVFPFDNTSVTVSEMHKDEGEVYLTRRSSSPFL